MRLLAVVVGLLALVPATASAHSIIRVNGPQVAYTSSDATSLNTLVVRASGSDVEFNDPTVDGGIDYGSCRPGNTDANGYVTQAFCPAGGLNLIRIDLGEREDTLEVTVGIAVQALGGPGADRLRTGAPADVVVGGEGNDEISSGAGDDKVLAGEGDDLVAGGAGNDELQAGLGRDTIDAGPGDDDLRTRDGLADKVVCGDGADRVDADTLDDVAADCESVVRSVTAAPAGAEAGPDGDAPRVRAGGAVRQRLGRVRLLATSSEPGTIAGSGFLEIGGVRSAVKTARVAVALAGEGVDVRPKLSARQMRRARAALRRGRRVRLVLAVVATDRAGNSREARAPAITLRR